jgi:hypothetical protein
MAAVLTLLRNTLLQIETDKQRVRSVALRTRVRIPLFH